MDRPILNIADIEFRPWGHGAPLPPGQKTEAAPQFAARLAPIGAKIGAQKLGYGVTAIPPGKRAFPRHAHHVNDEMFFILEGSGEVRSATRLGRSARAISSPVCPAVSTRPTAS